MKSRKKKGRMPPALAKYWRMHRRGKGGKHMRVRSRRRKNPSGHVGVFRLAAQKGNNKATRLYFDGEKFAKFRKPQAFGSLALVRAKANSIYRRWGKALKGYELLAVPNR